MKNAILFGVLILSLAFVSTVSAGGYGPAGCGLGSLAFEGKTDMVSQVLASTTNGTAGNQTFGISSGTSNCDASGLVVAEKEIESFVAKNYDSLTKEMAAGSGEHLGTLAGMMGYSAEGLGSYTKANYGKIFKSESTTPVEMLVSLKAGMAKHNS